MVFPVLKLKLRERQLLTAGVQAENSSQKTMPGYPATASLQGNSIKIRLSHHESTMKQVCLESASFALHARYTVIYLTQRRASKSFALKVKVLLIKDAPPRVSYAVFWNL